MDSFIFPQNFNQHKYITDYLNILFIKYTNYKKDNLITKTKNSQYERLTDTLKRGKVATYELIDKLVIDCGFTLPAFNSERLELLYTLQNIKGIYQHDEIYHIIAHRNYFKSFKIFETEKEGNEFFLNVIQKDMENKKEDKTQKIESILVLLGAMDLNREEVMKIIHFLARQ